MRVNGVGIFLIFWFLTCSSSYSQPTIDSLITLITSGEIDKASPTARRLAAVLKHEKIEVQEILAPGIIDRLNITTSVNTINALITLGYDVYEAEDLPVWSIQFYKQAYEQAEKLHHRELMAASLKSLALIYFKQDMRPEALKYAYEASQVFDERKDNANAALMFYYAASVNYRSGNFADCINDFEACLKHYAQIPPDSVDGGLRFSLMSGWNTMGLTHRKMENYGKSLEAFQKALEMAKEAKNQFWIALVNGNKGTTLFQMGRAAEAIPFAKEDMRISASFQQYASAGFACVVLVEIYLSLNQTANAKAMLDSIPFFINRSKSDKILLRNSFARVQAKYFALTHQFEKAYEALTVQIRLGDSIRNEERSLQLSQIQAGYNLEKKENEIQLLAKNNELQRKEINSQRFLIIGSIFFALLVVVFLFYFFVSYRREKRQKEVIEQQREDIEEKNAELEAQSSALLQQNEIILNSNQLLETKVTERTAQLQDTIKELDTFLYHASHDIRRPIATLLGLESVARVEKNQSPLFTYVADTARDMDSMLSKLQMAYRINQPLEDVHQVGLKSLIQEVQKKFSDQLQQNGIRFDFVENQTQTITTSASMLSVVFQNLIENAIHFRSPEVTPWIKVSIYQNDDHLIVLFEDNGIGIDVKQLDKIFDLYYRGTDRSRGNGMGLYLTKKSLQKIGGEISVKSTLGNGATFTISLPKQFQNT